MTEVEFEHEKAVTLGRLVRGLIHELNNPVGTVLAFSQILLDAPRDEDEKKALKYIEESALACKALLDRLQRFARPTAATPRLEDVGHLIDEGIAIARPMLRIYPRINVTVVKPPSPVEVVVEHTHVTLALVSLLAAVLPGLPNQKGEVAFAYLSADEHAVITLTVQAESDLPEVPRTKVGALLETQGGTFSASHNGANAQYRLRIPLRRDISD